MTCKKVLIIELKRKKEPSKLIYQYNVWHKKYLILNIEHAVRIDSLLTPPKVYVYGNPFQILIVSKEMCSRHAIMFVACTNVAKMQILNRVSNKIIRYRYSIKLKRNNYIIYSQKHIKPCYLCDHFDHYFRILNLGTLFCVLFGRCRHKYGIILLLKRNRYRSYDY